VGAAPERARLLHLYAAGASPPCGGSIIAGTLAKMLGFRDKEAVMTRTKSTRHSPRR
jgi:hypothetical protein